MSAGSFRSHQAGGERQVRRAWVILEQHDGSRVIAEVLPTDISLTTEGDLDFGGAPWYAARNVQRVPYVTTLRLEGVLTREAAYRGDVPQDAPAELQQAPRTLSGKARAALERGEAH